MQLVVMAAVLAVVGGARQRCASSCRLTSVRVPVDACGIKTFVFAPTCEGQCYHEDPVHYSKLRQYKQHVCIGTWTTAAALIDGCDKDIMVPVATECSCGLCNPEDTECLGFTGTPSCSA